MTKNIEKKWDQVLQKLQEFLGEPAYSTWMSCIKIANYDEKNGTVFLALPDDVPLIKSQLENRYREIITDYTSDVFGRAIVVNFIFSGDVEKMFGKGGSENASISAWGDENILNPRYTFDTFVAGDNNRYPKAAAMAVADDPGKAYNPLFIFGDSGLGKTHLMHAIGQYIMLNSPKLKVLYVSSEMVLNEFIDLSRSNKMDYFKAKYRTVDILMIDDVQFLVGKDKTLVEVFNTYNTLFNMGKQLVFSSDRPPHTLDMDPRLTGRLSSGLTVDIQPPSFEIKVAILRNKAEMDGIELTEGMDEIIDLIAEKIKTNVREMEGAFNRVVAYSQLCDQPVNKAMAKHILKDIMTSSDIQPTPELIKKNVAKYFNIKVADIESKKRDRIFSNPRQIAMYLCRELTDLSLHQISDSFGGKDHTTILHACKKIKSSRSSNKTLDSIINGLEDSIRNS